MRIEQVRTNQQALGATGTHPSVALQCYRAELSLDLLDEQGSLLDWVIGYAFDTLHARHLDLRIVAATDSAPVRRET
jgi:hypothetical protein